MDRRVFGLLALLLTLAPACAYQLRFIDTPNTVRTYEGRSSIAIKGREGEQPSTTTFTETVLTADNGTAALTQQTRVKDSYTETENVLRTTAGAMHYPPDPTGKYVQTADEKAIYALTQNGFSLFGLPDTLKDGDTWNVTGTCPGNVMFGGAGTFTVIYKVLGQRDINGGKAVMIESRLTQQITLKDPRKDFTQTITSVSQVLFDEKAGLVIAVNDVTQSDTHIVVGGKPHDTGMTTKSLYWLTTVRTVDPAQVVPPLPTITPEPDFTHNRPIRLESTSFIANNTVDNANQQLHSTCVRMPTQRSQAGFQVRPGYNAYVWYQDGKTLYADAVYTPTGVVELPRDMPKEDVEKKLGKPLAEKHVFIALWGGRDGSRVKAELLDDIVNTKEFIPSPTAPKPVSAPDFSKNPPVTKEMYTACDNMTYAQINTLVGSTGVNMGPSHQSSAEYQNKSGNWDTIQFDDGFTTMQFVFQGPNGDFQIKPDMSKEDLDAQIGKPRNEKSSTIVEWGGQDGSCLTIVFFGDKLYSKQYNGGKAQ